MRSWRAAWVGLLVSASASAQVLVSANSPPGAVSGAAVRTVVRAAGWYFVFFTDGVELLYRATADGQAFGPAASVSAGEAPSQGFSVTAARERVGVVWGSLVGGTYRLMYREGTAANGDITFGAPQTIASAAVLRGFSPSVAFTETGTPIVSSIEYQHPYAGSLNGCGGSNVYRAGPYFYTGSAWQFVGYCLVSATSSGGFDKSVTVVVPTAGVGAAHGHVVNKSVYLSTSLFDLSLPFPTSELGEPWTVAGDLSITSLDLPLLSAVRGLAPPTDVHYLYQSSGGISYLRQDTTLVSSSANGLDKTVVSPSGSSPSVSRAPSDAGCFTLTWLDGAAVVSRSFSGSIAALSPPVTLFSSDAGPSALSAEEEPTGPPALSWREGTRIYFAFATPPDQGPVMGTSRAMAPADGVTQVGLDAGVFLTTCGVAAAGALVTLSATAGTIQEADDDPVTPGLQRRTTPAGTVPFTVLAPSSPGTATVSATPVAGGPPAVATLTFTAAPDRLAVISPPQTLTVGGCSAPVVLEAQTAAGAPASPASPLPINASGAGLSFFLDAACAVPLTSLQLSVATGRASLHLVPTAPGSLLLSAVAPPLMAASQVVTATAPGDGGASDAGGTGASDAGGGGASDAGGGGASDAGSGGASDAGSGGGGGMDAGAPDASLADGGDADAGVAGILFASSPDLSSLECLVAWSYQPRVEGPGPLTFTLSGDVPEGLVLDPDSGLVSWSPLTGEPHQVTLTAHGPGGSASQPLALTPTCAPRRLSVGCGCASGEALELLVAVALVLPGRRRRRAGR